MSWKSEKLLYILKESRVLFAGLNLIELSSKLEIQHYGG